MAAIVRLYVVPLLEQDIVDGPLFVDDACYVT